MVKGRRQGSHAALFPALLLLLLLPKVAAIRHNVHLVRGTRTSMPGLQHKSGGMGCTTVQVMLMNGCAVAAQCPLPWLSALVLLLLSIV